MRVRVFPLPWQRPGTRTAGAAAPGKELEGGPLGRDGCEVEERPPPPVAE
jgi:hypothetical protein